MTAPKPTRADRVANAIWSPICAVLARVVGALAWIVVLIGAGVERLRK